MGRYVNIMAKVSPECAERLERVAKQGMFRSKYEVVQAAVALMLMYADPSGEPQEPAEVERTAALREMFGEITDVRHRLSSVKPNGGKRIEPNEMIAFYGREALMLRVQDSSGNITTTTNKRDILELALIRTLPDTALANLHTMKRTGGYPNLLAALMDALRLAGTMADSIAQRDEVEEMFRDASDSDPRRVELGIENKPSRARNKRKFD